MCAARRQLSCRVGQCRLTRSYQHICQHTASACCQTVAYALLCRVSTLGAVTVSASAAGFVPHDVTLMYTCQHAVLCKQNCKQCFRVHQSTVLTSSITAQLATAASLTVALLLHCCAGSWVGLL